MTTSKQILKLLGPNSGAITRSRARIARLTFTSTGVLAYIKPKRYRPTKGICSHQYRGLPIRGVQVYIPHLYAEDGTALVTPPSSPRYTAVLTQQGSVPIVPSLVPLGFRCAFPHSHLMYEFGVLVHAKDCELVLYVPEGYSASDTPFGVLTSSSSV